MIRAFRSEFLLLNRFRIWSIASIVTIAFTTLATALMIITAQPDTTGVRPGSGVGMSFDQLVGPGGATAAVTWAIYGFGFLLLLTAFTSRIGNEFTKGTFRSALLHHPNRWSLIGGKMLALFSVAAVLMVIGLLSGAATAAVVAPWQGIDTTGWFGFEALSETVIEFGRMGGWAFAWALIGTMLAVLVRSVPLALGIGVFWFGPFENVVGDDLDFALEWFPGLLLQQAVSTAPDAVVASSTAVTTLAVYGVVTVIATCIAFRRIDVTS